MADQKEKSIEKFCSFFRHCLHYLKEFTEVTTLHGVKYLSMCNLHFGEIFLWLLVLVASLHGTTYLIANSWQHYNENPTVIAIQKNYREWNITFPAATFCFVDNLDVTRAKQFINEIWGIQPDPKDRELTEDPEVNNFLPQANEPNDDATMITADAISWNESTTKTVIETKIGKYRYYLNFLRTLVNTTYENLDLFRQYADDETLKNLNVKNAIFKVMRIFTQTSTFYDPDFVDRQFLTTPTEMGMCNTRRNFKRLYHYNVSPRYPKNISKIRRNFRLPTCEFANSLCYAKTEGTPSPIRYFIHSPYEIPDITSPGFLIGNRMGRDISFTALETIVTPQMYDLSPSQRKCRFMTEPTESYLQVYSFNLCRMQCRKKLASDLCGCVPYFYMKEENIPICGIEGLSCLSKYANMLISLKADKEEKSVSCDCSPQCIDCKYTVDRDTIQTWTFPVPNDIRFRWAIEKFSKIRIQRDVIYSFSDFVVSFGGTTALFLGCSGLSFVEIIYFFTLRLLWYVKFRR